MTENVYVLCLLFLISVAFADKNALIIDQFAILVI